MAMSQSLPLFATSDTFLHTSSFHPLRRSTLERRIHTGVYVTYFFYTFMFLETICQYKLGIGLVMLLKSFQRSYWMFHSIISESTPTDGSYFITRSSETTEVCHIKVSVVVDIVDVTICTISFFQLQSIIKYPSYYNDD